MNCPRCATYEPPANEARQVIYSDGTTGITPVTPGCIQVCDGCGQINAYEAGQLRKAEEGDLQDLGPSGREELMKLVMARIPHDAVGDVDGADQ